MICPLESPDSHHLLAAWGWVELGNHEAANEELKRISPAFMVHPDVLEIRWLVCEQAEMWDVCLELACALITLAPQNPHGWTFRAAALHQLKRTVEARDTLLEVVTKFPKDLALRYDLACYECGLGHLKEAAAWLKKAVDLDAAHDLVLRARQDPKLELLWMDLESTFHP